LRNLSDTNIVIRVDASYKIGAGHVMRCEALAERLIQFGLKPHFICRRLSGDYIEYFQRKSYVVDVIDYSSSEDCDWEQDAEAVKAVLSGLGRVSFLIVDHYSLESSWEKKLCSFVDKIMVIDDLANRFHDCDILLDQNLGRKKEDYSEYVPDYCRLLLGPNYALLSRQYSRARFEALLQRRNAETVKNVLVSLGGTDPNNVTGFVLDVLAEVREELSIDVVLGSCMAHRDSLEEKIKKSLHTVHFFSSVENLSELMMSADLAIGAGGVSSYERCCLGLPTIMMSTADNQLQTACALGQANAVCYLGSADQVKSSQLLKALESHIQQPQLLEEMGAIASNICDGYGADRIIAEIFPHRTEDGTAIYLRPADMDNAEIMLKWQIHPSTRKYARNSKPPTHEEHIDWLSKRINNSDCIFNMIFFGEEPAGVLRFDRMSLEPNKFEVSILVSPEYRGKGIASSALRLGRKMFPNLDFHAEVHSENKASHDLFSGAGFSFSGNAYVSKPLYQ